MGLGRSLHVDQFGRDNLPDESQWPMFEFVLPNLQVPEVFNCGEWLLDRAQREVAPDKPAILSDDTMWSYAELADQTNRIARVLTEDLGIVSGSRVLLRGGNSPMLFAAWLAVMRAGAIAVATMPMLRARELRQIVERAHVEFAVCAQDLTDELDKIIGDSPLERVISYGGGKGELDLAIRDKPGVFTAIPTSRDDVCVIAFTSGTTGAPKATMHFHRDVAAICETFARHIVPADSQSVFSGTPSIAFTFGLGGLLVFPLYFRGAIALPGGSTPAALGEAIQRHRVTHTFTSPTAYKVIAMRRSEFDLSSLRAGVSAGEGLSVAVSDLWSEATGIRLIDGIGTTEMMHIFISASGGDVRPGATGRPVPGYRTEIFDDASRPIVGAGTGRLGVRGPTGCRYLSDPRQREYVIEGWNRTGDIYRRDEDGYYWFISRADDMIVSGGYNIGGPEVEAALGLHPAVEECAVVGWPDPERGQIVKAFVVLKAGACGNSELARLLQEHVKKTLAPYKYPRVVEFRSALPKTTTGKLQRSALLQR